MTTKHGGLLTNVQKEAQIWENEAKWSKKQIKTYDFWEVFPLE